MQVRNVVSINRCTQRTFGPTEWQALRTQLASMKDALAGVVQNLGAVTAPGVPAALAAKPPAAQLTGAGQAGRPPVRA